MKIAQIAPPFISIPAINYGGTERVVELLTNGLISKGHSVTLFANTNERKEKHIITPLPDYNFDRYEYDSQASALHTAIAIDSILYDGSYDIVHIHDNDFGIFLADLLPESCIITLHNSPNARMHAILKRFKGNNQFVALSKSHMSEFSYIKSIKYVYNSVDSKKYEFKANKGDYFIFLGSIAPHKGIAEAIDVACYAKEKLLIAAKIDRGKYKYFEDFILPRLSKEIQYVGELNDNEKIELLKNSKGLLFPINWDEPFGLVIIEAMACGTPVIGFARGAAQEIIKSGYNGFLCQSMYDVIDSMKRVSTIDPIACRETAENFSTERMVFDYESLYTLLQEAKS